MKYEFGIKRALHALPLLSCRMTVLVAVLVVAGSAGAAPCNNWSPLRDGVDHEASMAYGFTLPKQHSEWKTGNDGGTMSASGTVIANITSGPGLVLYQGFTLNEIVDTTSIGAVAARSLADSSTNFWTLKIVVDGETRLEGSICLVSGYPDACPAGATECFSKTVHSRTTSGANCYSYEDFILEYPIAFRDSVRIVATARGADAEDRPTLYYNCEGWYTEQYVENYNYFCWGTSDTLGWFDYCDLGGLTTDTTGTGLEGGFSRLADVWSVAGTYDSAVYVDVTGPGNASSNRMLEHAVAWYGAGDVLRTTLKAAADSGATEIQVNASLVGWSTPDERAMLVLDADSAHWLRNDGYVYVTPHTADSTIDLPLGLTRDYAIGDSVLLFYSNQTTVTGKTSVYAGIEEWSRYAAYYDFGSAHRHYRATKGVSTGDYFALNGTVGEPRGVVLIHKPSLSAYSTSDEQISQLYWVQNHFVAEGNKYYTVLRHYMHYYVTGAGGLR